MLEKIINAISSQLGISPAAVTAQSDLVADLKADSLDIVQFIIIIENELGVSFDDMELKNLRTVGDIAAFAENLKK